MPRAQIRDTARDGQHVDRLLFAGNNLDKARRYSLPTATSGRGRA
jgi:hypothetical protein